MSRSSRPTFFSLKSLHFVSGNQLSLLQNGAMFFPALEAAIEGAQQEIFLETYIFKRDAIGMRIAAALERALRRGVKVRLMGDPLGLKSRRCGPPSLPAQARLAAFEAPSPAPPGSQAGLH